MRESLLFRIGVALVALISLMTAALFMSIEYFVGLQYRTLHQERVTRQAEEIQHFIAREIGQMEGLARFVAGDSDLTHSAAYHLVLRGENKALQKDVDRIAETFRLESVTVWDGDRVVADARSGRRGLRRADEFAGDLASPRAAALWIDGNIWIVAGAPLVLSGDRGALVQLARPLSPLLKGTQLFDPDTRIVPANPDSAPPEDAIRLQFPGLSTDQRLALDVRVADTVGVAMAETKQLLAISLVVTAVLLLVALTLFLARELRPLRTLTRLASAVGRGEFPQRLEAAGRGEVGQLVRADPFQLEQMLDNLIDNAWEAGGGEEVTVELGDAEGRVFLTVADRGPGFTREALDHLFEPFFTTKNAGTGLGLASCLAIARAHGGDIQVSCPERGRVTVWLPKDGIPAAHTD